MRFLSFLVIVSLAFLVDAQESRKDFFNIQKEMNSFYAQPENRKSGYKQFKRVEYYLERRLGRNGEIVHVAGRNWAAQKKYNKTHTSANENQRSYSGSWDFMGPYIVNDIDTNKTFRSNGRVNRITFHPTDPNIIYASTAGGGLFKTNFNASIWIPMTESLPVNNLSGVAVHPIDDNILFILTGDGDGCCIGATNYGFVKPSIGVLKTIDGGQTWTQTGLVFDEQNPEWPFDLKMHPTIPEIMYACTNKAIYRTLNGGDDWFPILNEKIYKLEFKIDNPSTIFAIGDENFYRSTSSGVVWNDTVAIPDFNGSTARMNFTTCPSNPDALYLIASPGTDTLHRGLFFSNNQGQSFTMVSNTQGISENGWYNLAIACHPDNTNEIIVGAISTQKSADGGVTFTSSSGPHADVHDLRINPLDDRIYIATDGGVRYTEDLGASWVNMSDFLAITQYYEMSVSQQDGNIVIGGTQDNGTFANLGGVTTVMDHILGGDGMDCAIHPTDDNYMIYSSQNGYFSISRDKGQSRVSLVNPQSFGSPPDSIWVTPVAWDPNDTSNIFIGYDPIYRSTNTGSSFTPIPDTVSGRRILHVAPDNSQRLYAGDIYKVGGDNEFHMWTSSDGGDNWTTIHDSPGFPPLDMFISDLTTNPDNDEEVWISVGGFEDNIKVYQSSDAGASWQPREGSLPNTPINTIVFEDINSTTDFAVYIGTDIGVFYRSTALGDWIRFGNDLPIVEIADLEISYANNTLVAATYGRGVWRSDLFSSCVQSITLTNVIQRDGKSYFFQASDSILSNLIVDPSFGININYQAGHAISLSEGFHATAENNAIFRAKNEGCTGGIPDP